MYRFLNLLYNFYVIKFVIYEKYEMLDEVLYFVTL